jgi:hypothetical protein
MRPRREWLRRWPWHDPEPLPPVEKLHQAEAILRLAEMRKRDTLATLRRQRREVQQNHFADDVMEALGL